MDIEKLMLPIAEFTEYGEVCLEKKFWEMEGR